MCGGSAAAMAAARPWLELMGTTVAHMGGPGAGQHTKMCNQILACSNMIGCARHIGPQTCLPPPPPPVPLNCLWRGHSVNRYRPLIPPSPGNSANSALRELREL